MFPSSPFWSGSTSAIDPKKRRGLRTGTTTRSPPVRVHRPAAESTAVVVWISRGRSCCLPWTHNNGAAHPTVKRARVIVRACGCESHLPNATTREHGIADRLIVTEHEVVRHRSRVLPLDDLAAGRALHRRIKPVLIRRRNDHCGRAEPAACDPYSR